MDEETDREESMNKPYKHEKWLYEQYVEKQKTMIEVAQEADVTEPTIRSWMDKNGIERRDSPREDLKQEPYKDEEWLYEQYVEKRKTAAEVAEEVEVTGSTIRSWMEKNGIERRDRPEALSGIQIQKIKDNWSYDN